MFVIEEFISERITGEGFIAFSTSHLIAIALTLLGVAGLHVYRKTLQEKRLESIGRWFVAFILLISEVLFHLWGIRLGVWDAATWLPLQLCSISLLLSIYMLLFKSQKVYEIVFFTGIAGAGMAIVTPALSYPFPHFRFIHFFAAHAFIIFACFYATWIMNFRPTLKSIGKTLVFLNALLLLVLGVNHLTGGNYMFVSRKPEQATIMDVLGDYPWYLLSLEGVAVVLFVLMYIPFGIKGWKRSRSGDMFKGI